MSEHNLIDTFFEVAASKGLDAPAARKELAWELDRPALSEYKAIWAYKNRKTQMQADIINFMLRYSIQYVVENYPQSERSERLAVIVKRGPC